VGKRGKSDEESDSSSLFPGLDLPSLFTFYFLLSFLVRGYVLVN
jgi:hypothetical protein